MVDGVILYTNWTPKIELQLACIFSPRAFELGMRVGQLYPDGETPLVANESSGSVAINHRSSSPCTVIKSYAETTGKLVLRAAKTEQGTGPVRPKRLDDRSYHNLMDPRGLDTVQRI